MIQIAPAYLKIVQDILKKYPYHFYAFGSRVKGRAKKFSDLDLCYKDVIPDNVIVQLQEKFESSDLPFKVDLLDWQQCEEDFQKLVANDLVPIQ